MHRVDLPEFRSAQALCPQIPIILPRFLTCSWAPDAQCEPDPAVSVLHGPRHHEPEAVDGYQMQRGRPYEWFRITWAWREKIPCFANTMRRFPLLNSTDAIPSRCTLLTEFPSPKNMFAWRVGHAGADLP